MSSIDIIIPIKGRPEMLQERSLSSLLNQTFQDFQVTVVDDGSSDEDFQRIQIISDAFSKNGLNMRVIRNEGRSGAAGARNYGLDATSSPYVLWFDSDDILLENKLQLSIILIESGNHDLAITRAQHILHSQLINEFWGEPVAPNRGTYEFHFPYQTMCALYRRSFLEKSHTKWHEDIEMMNDWLFSNEVLLKTDNWVFSPVVTSHYFVPTSESGSIGSRLTKRKIQSQKRVFQAFKTILDNKKMNYSKTGRLKLINYRLRLFISALNTIT